MKRTIIILLSILSGVCFGVAVSTHLLITGALNKTYRAYIVQSGSMAPALAVGSIVFTKSEANYSKGDIITFTQNNSQITHRIVSVSFEGGEPVFTTKGDANEEADSAAVRPSQIVGKAFIVIPYIGYLADFVRTPKGFVLLVVIPASIIIYEELKSLLSEVKRVLLKKGAQGNTPTKAALFIPIVGVALLFISQTGSFFLDNEKSTANILGAAETFGTATPAPTPSATPTAEATATPAPTSTPSLVGLVVINEVYYDPDSNHIEGDASENNFEWIEIFNNSPVTVNLKDWSITDNSSSDTISSGNRNLDPGKKVVLAKDDSVRVIWGIPEGDFIAIGSTIGNGLANSGDRLTLTDENGVIIDQISYGTNTDILNPSIPAVAEGHSIEREPAGNDTDAATDFVDREVPTPAI